MKKAKRIILLAVMVVVAMSSLTGCYFWEPVESHQFAVIMKDGVAISEVKGPGRYTDNGYRARIEIIDGQAKQFSWKGEKLLTSDKQPVNVEVNVEYARTMESVSMMWTQYNAAAQSDEALQSLVAARVARVSKGVTNELTLEAVLGRNEFRTKAWDKLTAELEEIGVKLLDVGVSDVTAEESYMKVLSEKAEAVIRADLAKEETRTKGEELLQEEAQTKIDVEKAKRANLVAEEEAKVFSTSKEMFELEMARIYAEALQNGNTIYLPSDTVLNLFGNGKPAVVPVE